MALLDVCGALRGQLGDWAVPLAGSRQRSGPRPLQLLPAISGARPPRGMQVRALTKSRGRQAGGHGRGR